MCFVSLQLFWACTHWWVTNSTTMPLAEWALLSTQKASTVSTHTQEHFQGCNSKYTYTRALPRVQQQVHIHKSTSKGATVSTHTQEHFQECNSKYTHTRALPRVQLIWISNKRKIHTIKKKSTGSVQCFYNFNTKLCICDFRCGEARWVQDLPGGAPKHHQCWGYSVKNSEERQQSGWRQFEQHTGKSFFFL